MSWFAPQRYYGPLVLEPNHARSFEARRGDAHEFIKEDAGVCVAPALGMNFGLRLAATSWGYWDTTCERPSRQYPQG